MTSETIGFLGVGHLADYTLRGLRRGGFQGEVLLSPRNSERAETLSRDCGGRILGSNQEVVDGSDLVVLSVRPAAAKEALSQVKLREDQVLISVVAGIPVADLEPLAEPAPVVRAMPVTAAEAASSPTLITPPHARVEALFAHCGEAIPVAEDREFEAAATNACVYGWYFALFECIRAETEKAGVSPAVARRVVLGMARGAAEVALAKPEETLDGTAQEIATEGSFTRLGLDHLEARQAFDPWREAFAQVHAALKGEGG